MSATATLVALLWMMGCSPTWQAHGTPDWINYQAAQKLERDCLSYYFNRQPELLYPNPSALCRQMRDLQRQGYSPAIDSWQL